MSNESMSRAAEAILRGNPYATPEELFQRMTGQRSWQAVKRPGPTTEQKLAETQRILRKIVTDVIEDGICTWCYIDGGKHHTECMIGEAEEILDGEA